MGYDRLCLPVLYETGLLLCRVATGLWFVEMLFGDGMLLGNCFYYLFQISNCHSIF
jgi:hypothetical protein